MTALKLVAPAFIEMAHQIVWCVVGTTDTAGRPRTRILHPLWDWDGETVTGGIITSPHSLKARHLTRTPFVSCTYWTPTHDTCSAECRAELLTDLASRRALFEDFRNAPPPVGYDPAIIPGWDSPEAEAVGVLRLTPWRLRVMPGGNPANLLIWQA
jgi:hypothetical protein